MVFPWNSSEPLGLPPGSIRALLAMAVVGTGLALACVRGAVPEELRELVLAVIVFYFTTRNGKEKKQ